MNLGGLSLKRLIGLSAAKARISKQIGIPLTRSGRNQKIGRIVTGGGCLMVMLIPVIIVIAVVRLFLLRIKKHVK
jgi:hypothetical protein